MSKRNPQQMLDGIGQDKSVLMDIAFTASLAPDPRICIKTLVAKNDIKTKRDIHYLRGAFDALMSGQD